RRCCDDTWLTILDDFEHSVAFNTHHWRAFKLASPATTPDSESADTKVRRFDLGHADSPTLCLLYLCRPTFAHPTMSSPHHNDDDSEYSSMSSYLALDYCNDTELPRRYSASHTAPAPPAATFAPHHLAEPTRTKTPPLVSNAHSGGLQNAIAAVLDGYSLDSQDPGTGGVHTAFGGGVPGGGPSKNRVSSSPWKASYGSAGDHGQAFVVPGEYLLRTTHVAPSGNSGLFGRSLPAASGVSMIASSSAYDFPSPFDPTVEPSLTQYAPTYHSLLTFATMTTPASPGQRTLDERMRIQEEYLKAINDTGSNTSASEELAEAGRHIRPHGLPPNKLHKGHHHNARLTGPLNARQKCFKINPANRSAIDEYLDTHGPWMPPASERALLAWELGVCRKDLYKW
ncbi:hypothetical protein K466DRAFT_636644, partial [Polyporus arcularius HHB13444]